MEKQTQKLRLSNFPNTNIHFIQTLLEGYLNEDDIKKDAPDDRVIVAQHLLEETYDFCEKLHTFIEEKFGVVTVVMKQHPRDEVNCLPSDGSEPFVDVEFEPAAK